MAETKYGKYFLNELAPEIRQRGFGRNPAFLLWTDDDIIKGSYCFSVMVMNEAALKVAHGPHIHKTPEILVALGMNPDDPKDLGAELELYMGKEMERHIITESTLVYIPANFLHCPFRVTRLERPFIFIQSQYASKMTEKSFKKLVKEEDRENMIFLNLDGTETD
jgi:hypothetical protein